MPYRVYKKTYPTAEVVEGSYNRENKTIIIEINDEMQHLKFLANEWKKDGNRKLLIGHNISVLQWGQGSEAHFAIEAYKTSRRKDSEDVIVINGYAPNEDARHIYYIVCGFGANARDKAIKAAKELAETGDYVLDCAYD